MEESIEFDASDPLVALLAWALTWGVSQLVTNSAQLEQVRHFLPVIAVAAAIGVRAILESAQGGELTAQTFLRALAAGAVAVLSHSQMRGFVKASKADKEEA